MIALKRVYDPPAEDDGLRVLVDRLWPRGLARDAAKIDIWLKEIAPSADLRKWFSHEPARWPEFDKAFRAELAQNQDELQKILTLAKAGPITLLFAARDQERNNAVVLKSVLEAALAEAP